jgi:hypothetical protein
MNAETVLLTVSLFAAWPTAVWADDDEHQCSVATLHGSFGVTFTGTANTPDGPSQRGGIARTVFDGRGKVVGKASSVADGAVFLRTFAGTYTVAADCTGSMSTMFTDALDGRATYDLVIDDDGREFRLVATPPPGTPSPVTLTAIGRKQFSRRSIH